MFTIAVKPQAFMTFEQKLNAAFEYAERQKQASRGRTEYFVLVAQEVRQGNLILHEQRRDEFGHPKTIVVAQKGMTGALRRGFKLAEKPAGLPKGVAPAEESEPVKKTAARTGRKTASK